MDVASLTSWLESARPDWIDPVVTDFASLRAGWESDVHRFALTHGAGGQRTTKQLVLRLYVGDQGPDKATNEFHGMKLLGEADYPVPQVVVVEPSDEPLGRPFMVMEFVSGDAEWGWDAVRDDAQRRSMFVELFRELHEVDWRPFVPAADHAELAAGRAAERTLADWKRHVDRFPLTGFGALLGWLGERLDGLPRIEPAVVHLDYHVGNVLVGNEGSAWVVDWTQVGVSDPRFDVAWTSLLMTESQGADVVRAEYERSSGPLPGMVFFDAAAAMKRLFSIAVSLHAGPEAMGMRPEAAQLMRDQVGAIAGTYDRVRTATGVRLPSVEALLG